MYVGLTDIETETKGKFSLGLSQKSSKVMIQINFCQNTKMDLH